MIVMLDPQMTAAPAPMDDTTPMMTDTTAMIDTAADQTITTTTMTDMETESTQEEVFITCHTIMNMKVCILFCC